MPANLRRDLRQPTGLVPDEDRLLAASTADPPWAQQPWALDVTPRVAMVGIVAYGAVAPVVVGSLGAGSAALAIVPAVLAGLTWGPRLGVGAGVALTAYNVSVFLVLMGPATTASLYRVGGTMGSVIVVAGAFAGGYLRNAQRRVVREVRAREAAQRDLQDALASERSLRRQLEQHDALKNLFLRAVGHDLRSPLVPIVSGVELLRNRHDQLDPATRQEVLGAVTRHANTLRRQMDALLDVDRLTAGQIIPAPRATDVKALLTDTVMSVVPATRTVEVESSIATARIDPDLMERIVENLLGNAVKHTLETVPLRLTAEATEEGLLVSLEQVGAPIDETLAGRLFNAYERGSDAATPGYGLGLSLVAGFAELHGGHAWVEVLADGAAFRALLATVTGSEPDPRSG